MRGISLNEYLKLHLKQIDGKLFIKPYSIIHDKNMKAVIDRMSNIVSNKKISDLSTERVVSL